VPQLLSNQPVVSCIIRIHCRVPLYDRKFAGILVTMHSMPVSFLVITPFLPHLPDGTIYRLGEIVEGGAFSPFWAGQAALGGTPELADGTMEVLRFLQHILGFLQYGAGGVGDASRLRS
jgi:hypothetical protein